MRASHPRWIVAGTLLTLTLSCMGTAPEKESDGMFDAKLMAEAETLAHKFLITDSHVDVPYRLEAQRSAGKAMDDVAEATDGGDFDWPRAKRGGLDLPFMSIYIPADYQTEGGAKKFADSLIDLVEEIADARPDRFRVVRSVADARKAFQDGVVGFALGMENGAPIEGDLANLDHFRDRGIRYITLTHSKNNHICDSSYDEERTWNGLSEFGKQLVPAMNRAGVMIDVSHISDDAFWQVIELSQAPVIASHSSCRKFTPNWERNIGDEMIRAIGKNGGVVQINFGSSFLTQEFQEFGDQRRAAVTKFLEESGVELESAEADAFRNTYDEEHSVKPFATLDDVVAHIDHVVDLAGIDHVGIGSDYDGVGDSLPVGLKDVSQYPNLIAALLKRGYTAEQIEKICSGNLMRVWSKVEAFAAS